MNTIEQCVVLCTISLISETLVFDAPYMETTQLVSFEDARRQFEREYLVRILKITSGNVTQMANFVQRNRTDFYKPLKKHQLE